MLSKFIRTRNSRLPSLIGSCSSMSTAPSKKGPEKSKKKSEGFDSEKAEAESIERFILMAEKAKG